MTSPPAQHSWKFFRTGGLDQVALETAADLLNLEHLDQKLWVALSCPVKGLEIDEKTLALIDADNDGRIRVPELLAAVKWAAARLRDPADLLKGARVLPLAAINEAPEGRALLDSARQILATLGRPDAAAVSADESGDTAAIFAASPLNGDGVIPPEATEDPAVQALIKDIIATVGGVRDRTGKEGVTAEKIDQFFTELKSYAGWLEQSAAKDIAVLGEATGAAVSALKAIRAKADDYFARCRLAAFDARATAALNRSEDEYLKVAANDMKLTAEEVAGLPLARIDAGRPLPFFDGVNPAWAGALAKLHEAAAAPLLGPGRRFLTEQEWATLNGKLAAYETWLGGKAGSAVEKLGLPRVREILGGQTREALAALVARDQELEPRYKAISDVNRLAHYHRDLRALLHNFVNFEDFYSPDRWAVFQAGTLYLDSRSTELCVQVPAPSPIAAMSKAFIAYCDCKRAGSEPMKIAACITQGDSDYLFVGRNGVFYDRKGRDWDATVTSIVDNPISIRQAFWSPYKKLIRLIEDRVAKRAAAADAAASSKLETVADRATDPAKAPPKPGEPPKKIDVGTVAALGVAVGAIGGALGAIATGLARLTPWQLPLVVVAVVLAISLPSMAIAWLKLRQRTIGPILEGNGWAINGRVKINVPFGARLTQTARLPPGARRTIEDPYEDKAAKRRRRLFWVVLIVALAVGIRAHNVYFNDGRYFWQKKPATPEAPKGGDPKQEAGEKEAAPPADQPRSE